MKYSSIPLAQTICTECKNHNIEHIVISPGSRNAPLTLSFTADPFFKCYSIVDERSAAFFALGIAQQIKKPVALICTSGSALLNYYPAIVEAYYSQVPLVVISADRPSYLIDKGDGQTIRQDGVFFNHIGHQVNLIQDCIHASEKWQQGLGIEIQSKDDLISEQADIHYKNSSFIKEAFTSAYNSSWPVHLNLPFEEPLYQLVKQTPEYIPVQLGINKTANSLAIDWESYKRVWDISKKILIIIGQCTYEKLSQDLINKLGNAKQFLVMTESTANVHHDNFIERIDSLLVPLEKKKDQELWTDLHPDLVITIGGAIVSKKIKQFLRTYAPKSHWHWGTTKANNTFFKLDAHLNTELDLIVSEFISRPKLDEDAFYKSQWIELYQSIVSTIDSHLDAIPFSDLWVHASVAKLDLKGVMVHFANSASIRYAQLLPNQSCTELYCNRGVSGIDGSTSTAIGGSVIHKGMSLLVTGDLSFLYDSNAFWNSYVNENFRVIVVNNSGGGIFRILPTSITDDKFETFFETPHQVDLKALCKAYGLSYSLAVDKESLEEELSTLLSPSSTAKILEVKTPRTLNDKVLSEYFEYLSDQIN